MKHLHSEVSEMRANQETLEKERDFYFGKLRDIEVLLQANAAMQNPLTQDILKILYASEEEKVMIGEDGTLKITAINALHNQDNEEEDEMLDVEEHKN